VTQTEGVNVGRGLFEPWHLILLVVLVAVLFGWKKLPDITRSVGRSMRIFKSEVSEMKNDGKEARPSAAANDTVVGDVVPPENAQPAPATQVPQPPRAAQPAPQPAPQTAPQPAPVYQPAPTGANGHSSVDAQDRVAAEQRRDNPAL
jgi:sec-independent protein translocase protein TatA